MTSFSSPGCLALSSFLFPHSSLPSSLSPPFFLPFPPHPRTTEPFRKTEVEAATRKMVQPSPLPHGWGWRLTPSWEDWLRLRLLLWRCGQRKGGGPELLSGPISCYNLGVDLEQAPLLCTGGSTRESLPRGGALGRWHRFWDPCSPRLDNLPCQSQQTPPIPLPHPVLYLVLLSSRQEAENRHLKPTQALLSAPGTLQQLVWVLLPGWEDRVQWGGLSDKPEECAGQAGGGHCGSSHLALALGRSGWSVRALGLARTCGAPHPEHRQELITWRTSSHLGLGPRTKLDHTEGHQGAANTHQEKGCRQALSESGRLPDNEDSDLGGRCLSDDPVQHPFYIILQLGKRKLPRGDKQHSQGHTASPWFSQGQISSRVGDEGRPAGGMPCHMALAACHHLSLLCHPGSEAGLCQQHGPPCLQDCWVGTEQYFWGQLGICAARTGPWGKHPAGAASSLALINLLEACRVPNKE